MKNLRLLQLADLLEADARKKKGIKFDMYNWGTPSDGLGFKLEEPVPVDCRTSACALGLAAISGAFANAGLGYRVSSPGWLVPILTTDPYITNDPYAVGAHVFGLSHEQAVYLFDPDEYPEEMLQGAKAERFVANRIREMVAANGSMTQKDDAWD